VGKRESMWGHTGLANHTQAVRKLVRPWVFMRAALVCLVWCSCLHNTSCMQFKQFDLPSLFVIILMFVPMFVRVEPGRYSYPEPALCYS
jgi:ACR3 family arsenite efflux pump ArsB